ncbi:MAG: NADH-quinone oxidoreductase subunit C [Selenomonas sp.]|uniref:hydrogenase large subunit n=1 Tax=Selenomonas sp. TaxID=2053611 RepID=UPI0025E32BC9|nr:NADH-quinone oxidoreductase subunit C [Selenomonas sp.]MCR5757708.1 NADH-quinone oxidoreductase subunit C [Selenomonas sp.]
MADWSLKVVSPENFRGTANILANGGKNPLTAMFGRDETLNPAVKGYAIYAVFENLAEHRMEAVKAVFGEGESLCYESLTPVIPAAAWYEREIQDMFGIVPQNHPDPRPLVLHDTFPDGFYPLRKQVEKDADVHGSRRMDMSVAKGEGVYEVPVGPIHAGIIEPGHFRFSQAGESMLQLDARLFYTHRGLEKLMEGKTPEEALPIVERICGACSVANTWSYCQAVEKIAGVKIPRRAAIIRTLLMEIERITNHVGDLGNIPAGVGFNPAISLGGRTKEMLMRLQERIAGNRFLRGMIVPGGVRQDVDASLCKDIEDIMDKARVSVDDLADMFAQQANFQNRVRTTGIVRKRTAVDLAMVGVGARASGFAHDSRKDFVYGLYPELDFQMVTEKQGDVAARLAVRIAELAESFQLVHQLIAILRADKSTDKLAEEIAWTEVSGEDWGISESARGSNFQFVALAKGRIDRIFVRSASYPNWPAVTIAVQGDIIPDFPLINKSFELCYACMDR